MRWLYFIPIILCISATAFGQNKSQSVPIPKTVKGVNENCHYINKHSPQKRRSFYPFSEADSVVLVSFRHHYKNYPIKGELVLKDSLVEAKHLSSQEIDQLTDILYNNFYIKADNVGLIRQCFTPRNAILFYGKAKRLKESIIICFHCSQYETSSDRYGLLGEDCEQKLVKIKAFFIAKGVAFGTDTTIDAFPGESFGDEIKLPSNFNGN